MAFNPKPAYKYTSLSIPVKEFHEFHDEYVTRPPYQRKVVWNPQQQQSLLESLFLRYFIPGIVIREVRLTESSTIREVIDGQQRIITVQKFFADQLELPKTEKLREVDSTLPGSKFGELRPEIRRFIDRELQFEATIIENIDDPLSDEHRNTASEIFWRLQQGESLNRIETAHSRISSLVRNFLVKYAGDYSFDYEQYGEIDPNPDKHKFFLETRSRTNNRMQHLALLGRFLLLERAGGPIQVGDKEIAALIEATQRPNGIGDMSYENEPAARQVLQNLNSLHHVFHDAPELDKNGHGVGVLAFRHEYFTISCYLLLRHLRRFYVFSEEVRLLFREFVDAFYQRTNQLGKGDESARDFVENRQQGPTAITRRDQIMRHEFFAWSAHRGRPMIGKDTNRAFSENERIAIYLRDNGICQMCLDDGLPEREAIVPWKEYEADHVLPHSRGGQTLIDNGQVLCRSHNRRKGARHVG